MHRRVILIAATAAILAGATAVGLASGWLGGPTRHDVSTGPLSTFGSRRSDQTLALDPVNAGKTYSVATRLCVTNGEPVVLEDARPSDTLGGTSDWTYLVGLPRSDGQVSYAASVS